MLIMGGDFNCTVDFNKDRKSAEPHPPSTRELAAILESTDLEVYASHHSPIHLVTSHITAYSQSTTGQAAKLGRPDGQGERATAELAMAAVSPVLQGEGPSE